MTPSLLQLVERKLDEHPKEPPISFEEHKAAALHEMTQRLAAKRVALRTPSDPRLISIKSWQYGLTEAGDDEQATRSFADGLYLSLQSWRSAHRRSADWRAYLGAFDRPTVWLELGRDAEADGWTIEANACFAAARWLDPSVEPVISEITTRRGPELPARLLRQPDASFPAQPFGRRHWLAWDMKNYGPLDLPTLLRWECDRNFSIRTRIYRSLGQQRHPAAIQALQEGTLDPHPFARAQAVRSLGWCTDPTFVERLRELAERDPDAEVRRSAAKAVQRIVGHWRFYGEWNAILASSTRLLEVARVLIDEGLPGFVFDLLTHWDTPSDAELEAIINAIEPEALERIDPDDEGADEADALIEERSRYHYWFEEAGVVERTPEPAFDLVESYAAVGDSSERGFEARRALRRRGLGTLEQRRLRSVPSWPPRA